MKDLAAIHVAAVLDPAIKNARLQSWGHAVHWNDVLAVLRECCPQEEFIDNYPNPYHLKVSVDQSEALALLGKWAGKDEWTALEESIAANVTNPYLGD